MSKFYFTYGTEGYPFYGGWTEVEDPDDHIVCDLFRAVHPDTTPGLLNCASVYSEDEMKKTRMFTEGNFGHFAWETITVSVKSKE